MAVAVVEDQRVFIYFNNQINCFVFTLRLFEMGFAQQLHEIIHRLPDSR